MIVSVLAVMKAGGTYLPLDPAFPRQRLAFMVDDSALTLVVSETEHAEGCGAASDEILLLDAMREELAKQDASRLPPDTKTARPDDAAYVLYTSGSTGKPKGVLVPHRAACNVLTSMARGPRCGAGDRWLAVTTLSFDIALLEILEPLIVGAEVVIATRDEAMDATALKRLLDQNAITIMQATPVTWRMLIDSGWTGRAGLKVICGGEALPPDLATALVPRVGELWNYYGPTETTVWSTGAHVTDPSLPITIGRPIANTSVWILDSQMQVCPIGVPGEICIGGDGVALGYLNRPELTAERFIDDPRRPGSRLYRTGDLGRYRADGQLECLGRTDFQVKVRGFRIELGEIDARLAEHAAIREACVIVHQPPEGEAAIAAYYALRPGHSVTVTDLRTHLKASLPDYMVPQQFIEVEALPRTQNGKIDRKALPSPRQAQRAAADVAAPPRTPTERAVAEVWGTLLGRADLSVNENFLDAGGHSLLIMQAIARLGTTTGVTLSPHLFTVGTMAHVAAQIDAAKAKPAPQAVPVAGRERRSVLGQIKRRIFG
jgi:amino acid adenylation domain-containing protein